MGRSRKSSHGHRGSRGRKRAPVNSLPVGKINVVSAGYGFVDTAEGTFFVPEHKVNGAMDGDTVRVRPLSDDWRRRMRESEEGGGREHSHAPAASVERVLERATSQLVGKFVVYDGIGFVIPQDARLDYLIRANPAPGVVVSDGDIVLLRIDVYPSKHESPSGMVERVLGREDDPGILEEIFAARHGIETVFTPTATEEAEALVLDVDAALREPDRRDIRDRYVFTIDPADARDFDDALSLDYIDGTMRVGVHIADVSTYVRWGSSLDLDARRRGTSVYFPDRVIPMLPEQLSNGLCSLNPGEDRLAFTVDIYLDQNASVIRSDMYPSVIRSSLRLDYDHVQRMFDGDEDYPCAEAKTALDGLHKASRKLRERRMRRGALDFDSTELKVTFDGDGKPDGIIQRRSTDATELIEEFMILANETVAGYMLERGAPMVYRVHDDPNPGSLEAIVPVLREFGYAKDGVPLTNKQIQEILDDVDGKPTQHIVSTLLLRSMKQAVYRDHYTTHFGLASPGYTHFTSPIRRYPDLMAHRLLRLQLFLDRYPDNPPARPPAIADLKTMIEQLDWLCSNSSLREREAEKASYEALDSKICEYMEQFVGERFSGLIVNVMRFGFFVRLENGCEGLVPVRELDGWFDYDEARRTLSHRESGEDVTYRLGQNVAVELVSADKRTGKMEFRLV